MTKGTSQRRERAFGEVPERADTRYMEVYSRSLFRATLGQVHLSSSSPDPDDGALDLLVSSRRSQIGVQLKSSYSVRFNSRGTYQFAVKPWWVERWHEYDIPPRLVLYSLPRRPPEWCVEKHEGMVHPVIAYWALLDRSVSGPSVTIDRRSRFTAATLAHWCREVDQGMGGLP